MSSNQRLLLRLTTQCNSGCEHCTIADIAHHGEKSFEDALLDITRGREAGCTELVFMRGEPTLRRDLIKLVRHARSLGYSLIQIQTNARLLAYPAYAEKLAKAGANYFEVSFFAHERALHDSIDRNPGAFDQAIEGLRNLLTLNLGVLVTIPVIKRNYIRLESTVRTLADLGVSRIQFNFSRPVKVGPQWQTNCLVRLSDASPFIRDAMKLCRELGVSAETEAIPLCHLDEEFWSGGDIDVDFGEHRVEDVHRSEDSRAEYQRIARPWADVCRACDVHERCPTTWAAYQELYGTWEFSPIRDR
jgi:MoaA/NifB/PqqE/SkfB family radical SAM enzyme